MARPKTKADIKGDMKHVLVELWGVEPKDSR